MISPSILIRKRCMKRYRYYIDPDVGNGSSSNSAAPFVQPSNYNNWLGHSPKHPRLSNNNSRHQIVGESWHSLPNINKKCDDVNDVSKINKKKEKNKRRWEKSLQKFQQKSGNGNKEESHNEANTHNGKSGFQNRNWNNHLPDRWNHYSKGIGRPLENTRFLPFKCPLGPEFFQSRKDIQPFNVHTITEYVTSFNGQLGLVVDLTATNRYYDSRLWSEYEVKYEKHSCPGQSVNTNEYSYRRFAISINRFLQRNADNEKLIGVHCTHGLNRTGYLICRFLIEEQRWTAKRAIECFAEARGYPIERENYVQTLYQIENRLLAEGNYLVSEK